MIIISQKSFEIVKEDEETSKVEKLVKFLLACSKTFQDTWQVSFGLVWRVVDFCHDLHDKRKGSYNFHARVCLTL